MSRTDKDRPSRVRAAQDEPAVTHDHRAAPITRTRRFWPLEDGKLVIETVEIHSKVGDLLGDMPMPTHRHQDHTPGIIETNEVPLRLMVKRAKLARSAGASLDELIVVGTQTRFRSALRSDTIAPAGCTEGDEHTPERFRCRREEDTWKSKRGRRHREEVDRADVRDERPHIRDAAKLAMKHHRAGALL